MTTHDNLKANLLEALKAEFAYGWEHLILQFPGEPRRYHCPASVMGAIEKIPQISGISTELFNRGNSQHSFSAHYFGQALIAGTIEKGAVAAVDDLYAYLEADRNDCIEVCLLGGIEVTETFELLPGVFLAPPREVPESSLQSYLMTVADNPPVGQSYGPHAAVDIREPQRIPKAALYRFINPSPKFVPLPDLSKPLRQPTDEELDRIRLLDHVSNLLTLVGPSSPIIWRTYTELVDGSFLKDHLGKSWSIPHEETRVTSTTTITRDDISSLEPVIRSYFALPRKTRVELEVPLQRLNEAIRHITPVNRAIDLGIALESLLLSGRSDPAQLAFQLRLRGAWLLGNSVEDRRMLALQLKELYTFRSKAAHTGKVVKTNSPDEYKKVVQMLQEGTELCAKAIRAVILAKEINWDDLVLGGHQ